MKATEGQSESQAPTVPVRARQGAKAHGQDWMWVKASGWSERMLAVLVTASKETKDIFFAARELFTMVMARGLASQSR